MEKELKIFHYTNRDIRTIIKDGEPWFVAKDICSVLEINNPSQAMARLDEDERNTLILNEGIRGNPNMACINEPGLYSLILGSRKPEAKAFKRWITHEVLPSIRKTGSYSVKPTKLTLKESLLAQVKLIEANEALQVENKQHLEKIEEDKPKVDFAETVAGSSEKILLGDLAKLTDGRIGRNRLFALLKRMGILMKDNKPYQTYQDRGYFEVSERIIKSVKGDILTFTTYCTGKGQVWILGNLDKWMEKDKVKKIK